MHETTEPMAIVDAAPVAGITRGCHLLRDGTPRRIVEHNPGASLHQSWMAAWARRAGRFRHRWPRGWSRTVPDFGSGRDPPHAGGC